MFRTKTARKFFHLSLHSAAETEIRPYLFIYLFFVTGIWLQAEHLCHFHFISLEGRPQLDAS